MSAKVLRQLTTREHHEPTCNAAFCRKPILAGDSYVSKANTRNHPPARTRRFHAACADRLNIWH